MCVCVCVFSCWVNVYKILIRLCVLEQRWKYIFFFFFLEWSYFPRGH